MPKAALAGLREAAVPKKRFFGTVDTFHDYLKQHGRVVANYEWSGYVLATLVVYLEKERSVDLMKSEFDELSSFLSEARAGTYFIFTDSHKAFLPQLEAEFSEQELCDYYNKFNATEEPDAGVPMVDGVRAFRDSLSTVDSASVVVLGIG